MPRYYSDMVDRPHWVYRLYDEVGDLLYVGLTMSPNGRMAKHRRREWWPEVSRCTYVAYDGREAAKAAERSAIHHEIPIYNISRPRMECC